jgi:hypothetical protein
MRERVLSVVKTALTKPGTGQLRDHIPPGQLRAWSDPMCSSHLAFLPAVGVAAMRSAPLPELAALQAATFCLSLVYHREYERPGALAKAEGVSAKLLFACAAAA